MSGACHLCLHATMEFIKTFVLMIFIYCCSADDQWYRCPANLPRQPHLKTFGEKCYEFFTNELTWDDARDVCISRGGLLVQIRSAETQAFVMASLSALGWNKNGLWIGAHDKDNEGDWKWMQGDRLNNGYTNWGSDQPGGCTLIYCGEDCANLRLDDYGRWHDYACDLGPYSYTYICEYSMLPATTTTTTSTTTTTTIPTTRSTTTSTIPPTTTTTTTQPTTTTTRSTTTTSTTTTPTTTTSTTTMSTTTTSATTTVTTAPSTTTESTTQQPTTTNNPTLTTKVPTTSQILSLNITQPTVILAQRQSESDSLNSGEIAGIVISLLVLAFIGGFVCALMFIRKKRKELPDREYVVTFDNITYVVRALNPFQRSGNGTRSQVNLNNYPSDLPPQYEDIDNERNNCRQLNGHYVACNQNLYDVVGDIPTPRKNKSYVKSVNCEKPPLPDDSDVSCEKPKVNEYDVPDDTYCKREEQPYQEIPLPQRCSLSTDPPERCSVGHYSTVQDDGACGYETPVTTRSTANLFKDIDEKYLSKESASYTNNLYNSTDA